MAATATSKHEAAAFAIIAAVGQAIKELGEVPSGHLYARLMDRMSIDHYEAVIDILVKVRLVIRSGHVLKYVGPANWTG